MIVQQIWSPLAHCVNVAHTVTENDLSLDSACYCISLSSIIVIHPNDTDRLLFVTVLFSVFSANVAAYNIKVWLTQSIKRPLCNYFFICHFYQLTVAEN